MNEEVFLEDDDNNNGTAEFNENNMIQENGSLEEN